MVKKIGYLVAIATGISGLLLSALGVLKDDFGINTHELLLHLGTVLGRSAISISDAFDLGARSVGMFFNLADLPTLLTISGLSLALALLAGFRILEPEVIERTGLGPVKSGMYRRSIEAFAGPSPKFKESEPDHDLNQETEVQDHGIADHDVGAGHDHDGWDIGDHHHFGWVLKILKYIIKLAIKNWGKIFDLLKKIYGRSKTGKPHKQSRPSPQHRERNAKEARRRQRREQREIDRLVRSETNRSGCAPVVWLLVIVGVIAAIVGSGESGSPPSPVAPSQQIPSGAQASPSDVSNSTEVRSPYPRPVGAYVGIVDKVDMDFKLIFCTVDSSAQINLDDIVEFWFEGMTIDPKELKGIVVGKNGNEISIRPVDAALVNYSRGMMVFKTTPD